MEIKILLNGYKTSYNYLHEAVEQANHTLYDLCKSHKFFIKEKRQWFGGNSCEEMDTTFRTMLKEDNDRLLQLAEAAK